MTSQAASLPFRHHGAPATEYFLQNLDHKLQGLPGIYRRADDLRITGQGDTKEDADKDHDGNVVYLRDVERGTLN